LRHDRLLHVIAEDRMKGKPTRGRELKCYMIWQMMMALLHSNGQLRDITRLGLGWPKPPQRTSQPPQTGTVIGLFLHGCFGHHAGIIAFAKLLVTICE